MIIFAAHINTFMWCIRHFLLSHEIIDNEIKGLVIRRMRSMDGIAQSNPTDYLHLEAPLVGDSFFGISDDIHWWNVGCYTGNERLQMVKTLVYKYKFNPKKEEVKIYLHEKY